MSRNSYSQGKRKREVEKARKKREKAERRTGRRDQESAVGSVHAQKAQWTPEERSREPSSVVVENPKDTSVAMVRPNAKETDRRIVTQNPEGDG